MINKNLKIRLVADIQIEITASAERHDEYRHALDAVLNRQKTHHADILAIAGDVFQRYDANDAERALFADFVVKASKIYDEIVIIDGNHDIKQNFNSYTAGGERVQLPSPIKTSLPILKNVLYFPNTGVFDSSVFTGLCYAVWGQRDKHNKLGGCSYSPVSEEGFQSKIAGKTAVTLYHDCIQNAMNFNGEPVAGHEAGEALSIETFGTKTVLAGDIHLPARYEKNGCALFYPSSLVARDFGEGDYLPAGPRSSQKHGFMDIVLMPDGSAPEYEFIPVAPLEIFATVSVNEAAPEIPAGARLKLRIACPPAKYLEMAEGIAKDVNEKGSRILSVEYLRADVSETEAAEAPTGEGILEAAEALCLSKCGKDGDAGRRAFEIFKAEYGAASTGRENYTVELLSAQAAGFRAFGRFPITIPIGGGITRISGTNGSGKSTLFTLLAWLATDFISPTQNAAKKTECRAACFNDSLGLPECTGSMDFTVNGTPARIAKKLKKEGKNIAQETTLVVGADKYEGAEALAKMDAFFGGADAFAESTLANTATLTSLLCSRPSDMAKKLLSYSGLDIFQNIENGYEKARAAEFEGKAKPAETLERLAEMLAAEETDKAKNTFFAAELELKQAGIESNIDIAEKGVEESRSKIAAFHFDENKYPALLSEAEAKVSVSVKMLADAEAHNQSVWAEMESPLYAGIHERVQISVSAEITATDDVSKTALAVERAKADALARSQAVRAEFDAECASEMLARSQAESRIADIKNTYESALQKHKIAEMGRLQEHKNAAHALEMAHQAALSKSKEAGAALERALQYLAKIADTDKCHACSRTLEGASLEEAMKAINRADADVLNARCAEAAAADALADAAGALLAHPAFIASPTSTDMSEADKSEIAELQNSIKTVYENKDEAYSNRLKSDGEYKKCVTAFGEAKQAHSIAIARKEASAEESASLKETAGNFDALSKTLNTPDKLDMLSERVLNCSKEMDALKTYQAAIDSNAIYREAIKAAQAQIGLLKAEHETCRKNINTAKSLAMQSEFAIESLTKKISECKAWAATEAALKVYKAVIGKNGIQIRMFSALTENINKRLHALLADMPFKLYFGEGNELIFDDMGNKRGMADISGMQTVFCGLALLESVRECSIGRRIGLLRIDEVSGALSGGENLSYEAANYRELIRALLMRMKTGSMLIIDHVIENLGESRTIEVKPTPAGSIINII